MTNMNNFLRGVLREPAVEAPPAGGDASTTTTTSTGDSSSADWGWLSEVAETPKDTIVAPATTPPAAPAPTTPPATETKQPSQPPQTTTPPVTAKPETTTPPATQPVAAPTTTQNNADWQTKLTAATTERSNYYAQLIEPDLEDFIGDPGPTLSKLAGHLFIDTYTAVTQAVMSQMGVWMRQHQYIEQSQQEAETEFWNEAQNAGFGHLDKKNPSVVSLIQGIAQQIRASKPTIDAPTLRREILMQLAAIAPPQTNQTPAPPAVNQVGARPHIPAPASSSTGIPTSPTPGEFDWMFRS